MVGEALARPCACRGKRCGGGNRDISVAKDTNELGVCAACCRPWFDFGGYTALMLTNSPM